MQTSAVYFNRRHFFFSFFLLSFKIMMRLMVNFPSPNIYLSLNIFFVVVYFLFVDTICKINNEYLSLSVKMLQRTKKHGRLRSFDEIQCPNYTFTFC